jgi:hypothetical protein
VVVHHYTNDYFPSVQRASLATDADVVEVTPVKVSKVGVVKFVPSNDLVVTKLCKHLTPDAVADLMSHIEYTTTQMFDPIFTETVINFGEISESVDDLYGIIITAYNEIINSEGKCFLLRHLIDSKDCSSVYNRVKSSISRGIINLEDLMELCNYWSAKQSQYISRVKQITHYKWVDTKYILACNDRLQKVLFDKPHSTLLYEVDQVKLLRGTSPITTIKGRVDIIGRSNGNDLSNIEALYEIKMTSDNSTLIYSNPEHFIQLATYMCLLGYPDVRFNPVLFNPKTGRKHTISAFNNPELFLQKLVKFRDHNTDSIPPTLFIEECKKIRSKYFALSI